MTDQVTELSATTPFQKAAEQQTLLTLIKQHNALDEELQRDAKRIKTNPTINMITAFASSLVMLIIIRKHLVAPHIGYGVCTGIMTSLLFMMFTGYRRQVRNKRNNDKRNRLQTRITEIETAHHLHAPRTFDTSMKPIFPRESS